MHLESPVSIDQDQGKKAQQEADEQEEQMEEQMQLDIVRVLTACMSPACNAHIAPAHDPVACVPVRPLPACAAAYLDALNPPAWLRFP